MTATTNVRDAAKSAKAPKIREVYGDPETTHQYHEDDWEYEHEPVETSVGWDLSWGCTSTFRRTAEGEFLATVSTFGVDKQAGITQRKVDREQLVDYARQLLALAEEDTVV